LCRPEEVVINVETEPPFIASDNWLEDVTETIKTQMEEADGPSRVPPMALMRCSRGGKTRALKEIGKSLKSQLPNAAIIYISFNNNSQLKARELTDPLAALRRRIAYAAMKDKPKDFDDIGDRDFREKDLNVWLGDLPCVLLIDELNLVTSLNSDFAYYLKENFLSSKGRYFVFSSHIVTTAQKLSDCMESVSNRPLLAPQLPTVPSLAVAISKLHWPALSARGILYYGCIPSLIYEAKRYGESFEKRQQAIQRCISENLINDRNMKALLESFISGDYDFVPEPLLVLMDSFSRHGPRLVKWIPFHIMEALKKFAKFGQCSTYLSVNVLRITEYFDVFFKAKNSGGDGWEALFIVVVLIRCLTGKSDALFLPLQHAECTVSFNEPFEGTEFGSITNVDDFLECIPTTFGVNHLAVYYPSHASFKTYDLFIAHYDNQGVRSLYGYQLKEGKAVPSAHVSPLLKKSIVVLGQTGNSSTARNGWHIAGQEEIDAFFGVSGSNWTPRFWKQLTST
jgi:hypothetical protein